MSDALTREIQNALSEVGQNTILSYAVRASRVMEDVPNPAASGLQQAFLGIVGVDAILAQIRACWATPWNSRAIYFRDRKKIGHTQVTMAVVIQPMVNADAAGVMFTANPLTGAADEIHIDAAFGLGEAVIAARRKPDHVVVNKNALTIRERVILTKVVMDVVSPEGGLQTISVPANQQDAPALSDAQILALAEIGKRVETHFKQPQDIEWCRLGESIRLVQTRPHTRR
jgi:pyruvate,water dikinase